MWKAVTATLAAVIISLSLSFGASAQQAEIEGTISSQLEAFKIDDFEQAFTYATPNLQRLFQTPQNFQRMVTSGYPMVWRYSGFEYLELEALGGDYLQKVQIVDDKGRQHVLLYRMQQTEQGWRIGGVQILQQPGATA
ncbi:MAG: DUF4864 domain-containing protein [Pseudomonadota bacterium]